MYRLSNNTPNTRKNFQDCFRTVSTYAWNNVNGIYIHMYTYTYIYYLIYYDAMKGIKS